MITFEENNNSRNLGKAREHVLTGIHNKDVASEEFSLLFQYRT